MIGIAKLTIIDDIVIQRLIIADDEIINKFFCQFTQDGCQILEDDSYLINNGETSITDIIKACETLGNDLILVSDKISKIKEVNKYRISVEEFCKEYNVDISDSEDTFF
jgi:hypothetical protein